MSYKSYVLLGDGELQEGGIWESMMAAAHFRLDNVVALVDCNNYQLDGAVNDIMNVFPLKDKIDAFGWNTQVVDGHNLHQLFNTLSTPNTTGKPTCIILQTIKGKGVTEMENTSDWHSVRDVGKYKSIIEKYYVV